MLGVHDGRSARLGQVDYGSMIQAVIVDGPALERNKTRTFLVEILLYTVLINHLCSFSGQGTYLNPSES